MKLLSSPTNSHQPPISHLHILEYQSLEFHVPVSFPKDSIKSKKVSGNFDEQSKKVSSNFDEQSKMVVSLKNGPHNCSNLSSLSRPISSETVGRHNYQSCGTVAGAVGVVGGIEDYG